MSADIYSSLVKALTMADIGGVSCYPLRVTAAAAIVQLVEVSGMAKLFYGPEVW